jgi:hypothetical protein
VLLTLVVLQTCDGALCMQAPNVKGDVAVHSHVREDLPTASLNVDMVSLLFT